MVVVAESDAKARAEEELARVRVAIEAVEEVRRMVEVEVARPEVERTSLMLDIGAAKDEVSSFQSQTGKENEAMGEDYQKAFFAYGYGCCAFKQKIYGD